MNMTSEDTVTETPERLGEPPQMTPEQFEKFRNHLAKIRNDPEFIRAMQNRQRAQAEFENLMAMDPEKRSKLLFTIQCHRMTAWHESVERARKERERKERMN
jgi:hypothetical protein